MFFMTLFAPLYPLILLPFSDPPILFLFSDSSWFPTSTDPYSFLSFFLIPTILPSLFFSLFLLGSLYPSIPLPFSAISCFSLTSDISWFHLFSNLSFFLRFYLVPPVSKFFFYSSYLTSFSSNYFSFLWSFLISSNSSPFPLIIILFSYSCSFSLNLFSSDISFSYFFLFLLHFFDISTYFQNLLTLLWSCCLSSDPSSFRIPLHSLRFFH